MAMSRTITNIYEADYNIYDMDGPVQKNMGMINISWNRKTGKGCYIIKMDPGAETIAHTHKHMEDYLIIEGDLIESDGTVLKKGDVVSYQPGTSHNSRTESGCLLIGVDWNSN